MGFYIDAIFLTNCLKLGVFVVDLFDKCWATILVQIIDLQRPRAVLSICKTFIGESRHRLHIERGRRIFDW